jgi:hypothetical protein
VGTLPGNITGEKPPFADFLDSPSGRFFKAKVAEALTRDFEQLARELLAAPKRAGAPAANCALTMVSSSGSTKARRLVCASWP